MKKFNYLLVILLFCFIKCNKIEVVEVDSNVAKTGVIGGEVSYANILTDQLVNEDSNIKVEIKSNGNASIPQDVIQVTKGSKFEFGPLSFGEYDIEIELVDSVSGIIYRNSLNDLILNSATSNIFKLVEISPKDQTVIVASTINSNQMPVRGATVYLYNSPEFLKQYMGTGAFIDSAKTNNLGRASFIDHVPGEYYLFPVLIAGKDTLTMDTTNLMSSEVIVDTINKLKVRVQ